MSAAKNFLPGLEKVIQEASRSSLIKGAKMVNQAYAEHAGRELQKGNGSVMATYNAVRKAIEKL